ncbi:MAG: response regulator [Bacteroidales bacterium]|nr:response regulator [Bacteroidales bacterium]
MTESVTQRLRVLIVEDNDLNAKFAEIVLKKYNIKADFATNGSLAIEKFLKYDYDLILMDIQMPLMNGIETTAEIRKYEKQLSVEKPVVIIAVTAFALEHDREHCLESGMNDYLTKPYKPAELISAIRKHFEI